MDYNTVPNTAAYRGVAIAAAHFFGTDLAKKNPLTLIADRQWAEK